MPVNFPAGGCTYQWTNSNPSIGLPASGVGNIPAFTATNNGNGPIVATITATPAQSGFAYIANVGANTISVINISSNQIVATIPTGMSPEGIAINSDGTRVYVTNYNEGDVSVIDATTNQVISTFQAGSSSNGPMAIVVSPDGNRIYVSDYRSGGIWVLDTKTGATISIIQTGYSESTGLSISPDGTRLYVANTDANVVFVINTATNSVVNTFGTNQNPWGITISKDGSRLYVTSITSGTVSVIDASTGLLISNINTSPQALGVAISPDGSRVYAATPGSNSIAIINTTTNSVIAYVQVGTAPEGVSVSVDGSFVYVTNVSSGNVSVISTSNNKVIATIPTGLAPYSIGNFISAGPGCNSTPVTFKITVNSGPAPVITTSTVTGVILGCVGSPGESPNVGQFTVAGTGLSGDITVTPPAGFDISLTAVGGYSPSLILKQIGGAVISTPIYVRSSASDPVGPISGNIQITTPGATPDQVAITGTVNALPTVAMVRNQTVNAGASTTAVNFTGTGNTFTWTNDNPSIGLPASGAGNIPAFTAVNSGTSPVTATIKVTPVPTGFAYVPNLGSDDVSVIRTADHSVVTTIPVGLRPYGVSVNASGNLVYITNSGSNTVSVIDAASNKVTATINVDTGPEGIVTSPDGKYIYVANTISNTVSVIDAATNSVSSPPITVGSGPTGIAISPDGQTVYVTNTGSGTVSVINVAAKNIAATIPVGYNPIGIAVSPNGKELYVCNTISNTVSIISTTVNAVTANVNVIGAPFGIVVSPDGSKIYFTNTSGYISILIAADHSVINQAAGTTNGISITADGSSVYAANYSNNSLEEISSNLTTGTQVGVGANPVSLGNFVSNATGCTGAPTTFTITVKPNSIPPAITAGTVSGAISACAGTPSGDPNIQQFKVSGANLTGNITATAPTNFEISLTPDNGYGSSVDIPQSSGNVSNVTIYVRSSASATGSISGNMISGNITLSSPGAPDQSVAVTGTIYAGPTMNQVTSQTVSAGQATAPVNFTGGAGLYTWTNDTPGIGLPANGTGNIPSFTAIDPNGDTPVTATITVMPQSMSAVACMGTPVTFTITVSPAPPPVISSSGTLTGLSTIYGTASSSESFTVSATNAPAGILVTAPQGFELSTDNITFSPVVNTGSTGPAINATVYIRLAATTAVGNYAGNIVLSTKGATDVNVNMPLSIVDRAPLTVTAPDVTRAFGVPNPVFVPEYQGFVNGDDQSNLDILPTLTTTATISSPAGKYAINVSGGASHNYTIIPVDGTLTITPSPSEINVPNAFTPNGDGINDFWNIKQLVDFPQCIVSVYSRYGGLVFQSHGYAKPWDGTSNGSPVPTGTYYYIINPNLGGLPVLSGYVAVLR